MSKGNDWITFVIVCILNSQCVCYKVKIMKHNAHFGSNVCLVFFCRPTWS